MKVALFTINDTFFGPLAAAFKKRGHEIGRWREAQAQFDLGRLMAWCDMAFVEFAQTPLEAVVNVMDSFPGKPLVVRMHRIEIYNQLTENKTFAWDKVDCLVASAQHVIDRFMQKRANWSKPKNILLSSTNVVDPERFAFVEREWKPPYRICMVGNFVPKKRQYTAIQYMFDLKEKFGDVFRLDIVGQRGAWTGYGNIEYYQNCRDLIEDLGLKDTVTIYDKIPNKQLPEFLAREHAIISNSNEEGTHVAIAEAAMTGCLPIVNAWRGSDAVYPQGIAERFRSPGEFVAICTAMKLRSEAGTMAKASKSLAKATKEKYGDLGRYDRLVAELEGLVAPRAEEVKEPSVMGETK